MKEDRSERLLNFIDGGFVSSQSGKAFDVINPATAEVIYVVEEADDYIRTLAVESAKKAFKQWSQTPAFERSRILLKAVSLLRERTEHLARVETLDTAKPLQEAKEVDVVTGADVLEFFASLAPTQTGICWVNSYGASPAEMPVGDYKLSGVGRENGVETLDQYTQTKSMYVGMVKLENPF